MPLARPNKDDYKQEIPSNTEYLTIEQVCVLLQINRVTLWKRRKAGLLKYTQFSPYGPVRILRSEVDRFVRENTHA